MRYNSNHPRMCKTQSRSNTQPILSTLAWVADTDLLFRSKQSCSLIWTNCS